MRARPGWPKTGAEIRLLARALGVLVVVRLLLPWVDLRTLLRWLGSSPAAGDTADGTLPKAGRYVDALLRRLPRPRSGPCLVRSLVLYHFATRCGLPVQVRFGARRVGETLQGHAWLSLNGAPFLETGDPEASYAVTFSYPEPARESVEAEAA